jgi:hypothetical protein
MATGNFCVIAILPVDATGYTERLTLRGVTGEILTNFRHPVPKYRAIICMRFRRNLHNLSP